MSDINKAKEIVLNQGNKHFSQYQKDQEDKIKKTEEHKKVVEEKKKQKETKINDKEPKDKPKDKPNDELKDEPKDEESKGKTPNHGNGSSTDKYYWT